MSESQSQFVGNAKELQSESHEHSLVNEIFTLGKVPGPCGRKYQLGRVSGSPPFRFAKIPSGRARRGWRVPLVRAQLRNWSHRD